jgi:hypothetical protein
MASALSGIALQLETQSVNSIIAGFSFASAIAWMDVVRWAISQIVQVSKNGGQYYFLSAIFTTLLSVVVFMLAKAFIKNVEVKEAQVAYAVTRA